MAPSLSHPTRWVAVFGVATALGAPVAPLGAQGSAITSIAVQEPGGIIRPAAAVRTGESFKLRIGVSGYVGPLFLGTSNPVVLPLPASGATVTAGIPAATLQVTAATVSVPTVVTITASTGGAMKSTLSRTFTVYPIPSIVSAGLVPAKSLYTEGEDVKLQVKLSFKDPIGGTEVNVERPRYQMVLGGYASWPAAWGGILPSQSPGGTETVTVPINSDVALLPMKLLRYTPQSTNSPDTTAVQHWTAQVWVGSPWQAWGSGGLAAPTCTACFAAKFAVQRALMLTSLPVGMSTLTLRILSVEVRTPKTQGMLGGDNPVQNAAVCVGTAANPAQFGKKTTDGLGKAGFQVPAGAAVVVVASAPARDDGKATLTMPETAHAVIVRTGATNTQPVAGCK